MVDSNVPTKILGVIPARFASTRFPGKALALLAGKPLVQHVYERASMARYLTRVVVATDDQRIADAVCGFGGAVCMTNHEHPSGTDRVAEVAASDDSSVIVNIQGDEPLIDPAAIDLAVLALREGDAPMATLKRRIVNRADLQNPNVVKVVTARSGDAIYFSRCPIPFHRESSGVYFQHIGLYVYRREFLLSYSDLPVGPLESAEKLEQLRALENGFRIRVAETEYESVGVDTPEDLEKVNSLFEAFRIHG
jgi:3-deoxy-manno-octulosonate cytidylyltransferase (CMP-KDO synthetase)